MKTLGLIGGTSWHSTIEYYRQINTLVGNEIGHDNNPELVLYSINIDVMRRQVISEIERKYLEVSQKLIDAGSEALMICANTPHMAVEYVQPKISVPFLHIADGPAKEAKSKSYNALGLLGNAPTMTKTFLKDRLREKHGLHIEIPEEHSIEKSHYYVSKELTQGIFSNDAVKFYTQEIKAFKAKGMDAVILGCTELPLLLKDIDTELPVLATTDLHIRMAVDFILNK